MYSFHKIKAAAATLTVGVVLALAFTATAQAGGSQEKARAKATDRYYQLGSSSPGAAASQAEKRRGQALDRYYHLGRYAVIETSSSFQWSDAAIGAGAMLGTILLAGGLAVTVRRRGRTSLTGTG